MPKIIYLNIKYNLNIKKFAQPQRIEKMANNQNIVIHSGVFEGGIGRWPLKIFWRLNYVSKGA